MVYIHDTGHVRDGSPPQQNIVHVDGNRSVLMFVLTPFMKRLMRHPED